MAKRQAKKKTATRKKVGAKAEDVRDSKTRKRDDQIECPFCLKFGCPAVNGSHKRGRQRVSYRECSSCKRRFRTVVSKGRDVWERSLPVT